MAGYGQAEIPIPRKIRRKIGGLYCCLISFSQERWNFDLISVIELRTEICQIVIACILLVFCFLCLAAGSADSLGKTRAG